MSLYCTLKWTTAYGFFGFLFITLLIFSGMITFHVGLDDVDEDAELEKTIGIILTITGWIMFIVMGIVTMTYFALWAACPAGSDLGNEGVDDNSIGENFKNVWSIMGICIWRKFAEKCFPK